MNAPRNVLVVGGAGRMGRWLFRVCQSLGDTVTVCDRDNSSELAPLAAEAEICIVAVPPRVAPETVRKLASSMPKDGLIVDVTSLKTAVAVAAVQSNPTQSVALIHPMCAPPGEGLSIGDAAIVLTEELVESSGPYREWYERFLAVIGGRRFRMNAVEHDRFDVPLQPGAHAALLAFAASLAATGETLESFERLAPPVAADLLRAVRRFLGSGSPEIFAWLQIEAHRDQSFVAKSAVESLRSIEAAAKAGNVAELKRMFADLRSRLAIAPP